MEDVAAKYARVSADSPVGADTVEAKAATDVALVSRTTADSAAELAVLGVARAELATPASSAEVLDAPSAPLTQLLDASLDSVA